MKFETFQDNFTIILSDSLEFNLKIRSIVNRTEVPQELLARDFCVTDNYLYVVTYENQTHVLNAF